MKKTKKQIKIDNVKMVGMTDSICYYLLAVTIGDEQVVVCGQHDLNYNSYDLDLPSENIEGEDMEYDSMDMLREDCYVALRKEVLRIALYDAESEEALAMPVKFMPTHPGDDKQEVT